MKIALIGNPNSGKTTLFNLLTNSSAHVGNWPGVTVEKRSGIYKDKEEKIEIIDLPGIYSLSPYTPEEIVSRNYILNESPDCILNIVDATNIERNLYLTTQILEMDVPVVLALNMMDQVKDKTIDVKKLEKELGIRVVLISALKKQGINELMSACKKVTKRTGISCIDDEMNSLIMDVKKRMEEEKIKHPLFLSTKLLENDELVVAENKKIWDEVNLKKDLNIDFEAIFADKRYQYITNILKDSVKKQKDKVVLTKTDKIDKVLTHPIFGIPIFIAIMFIIFHNVFSEDLLFLNSLFHVEITNPFWVNFFTGMNASFDEEGLVEALEGIPSLGVFLQSWMGYVTGGIIDLFRGILGEGSWFSSFICDGLLTGLDSIFSFLPQILLLFLFIAILEDSGYMARVAFIMDRAFRKFGLSGKAFIPLLMGFGCSVPAMMGTKTLKSEVERNRTIRIIPFFSCGAKAPIWALLAFAVTGSFLGDIFVFSIYLLGIVVAVFAALFMRVFSKEKNSEPFIMELPNYHFPSSKSLMIHLWEKLKHFVIKASTIITSAIVLIWFLSSFSFKFWEGMVDTIDDSILASIGKCVKYFFYPLGFGRGVDGWKFSVATITGLIAKEDVVATMAQLGLCDEGSGLITFALSNASIYSFAAYNLFTFPCFAAIATAKSETTKKEFLKTLLFWFVTSYLVSFIVYVIGSAFELNILLGTTSTILFFAIAIFIIIYKNKKKEELD